ncbi:MAG: hypothetical protein NVSMB6_09770 [Burkholderiaceae bacterium]
MRLAAGGAPCFMAPRRARPVKTTSRIGFFTTTLMGTIKRTTEKHVSILRMNSRARNKPTAETA